ncbi:hypothetical protein TREPR_3033 [Treponema primitia ZAS-2]|uniref:Uncharacterized protein n=1 Tax=Treponema primitia (strain ATCC BAA-887 / DSM 12427 / ZAS-2) TaxID=545694 RepID=F5YMS1_TREPZ|nr:hypothetical protein TREPR_3033 [Treponema primitia ZAS-2]
MARSGSAFPVNREINHLYKENAMVKTDLLKAWEKGNLAAA